MAEGDKNVILGGNPAENVATFLDRDGDGRQSLLLDGYHRSTAAVQIASGSITIGVADGTTEKDGPAISLPTITSGLGDRVAVFVQNASAQMLDLRFRHQVADPTGGLAVTGANATDLFTSTAHGYSLNDGVVFSGLTGGTGITAGAVYYVIASGLTANDFRVSTAIGGSTINFTSDVSAGTVTRQFFPAVASSSGAITVSIPVTVAEYNGVLVWIDGGLLSTGAKFTLTPVAAMDATYTIRLVAWIRN